jgi:hypothetical protein
MRELSRVVNKRIKGKQHLAKEYPDPRVPDVWEGWEQCRLSFVAEKYREVRDMLDTLKGLLCMSNSRSYSNAKFNGNIHEANVFIECHVNIEGAIAHLKEAVDYLEAVRDGLKFIGKDD